MDDADVLFIQMEDPFANVNNVDDNAAEDSLLVDVTTKHVEPETIVKKDFISNNIKKPNKKNGMKLNKKSKNYGKLKKNAQKVKRSKSPIEVNIDSKDDHDELRPIKKEQTLERDSIDEKSYDQVDIKSDILGMDLIKNEETFDEDFKENLTDLCKQEMQLDSENKDNNYDLNNLEKDVQPNDEVYSKSEKRRKGRKRKILFDEWPCCFCHEIFDNLPQLEIHSKTNHDDQKKFECDICLKSFDQRIIIQHHMETKHTDMEKWIACKLCGKSFKSINALERHASRHDSPVTFQCHVCHKTFESAFKLKKHMKGHTAAKIFPCDICQKPFQSAYLMKFHRIIHSGKRDYKCDVCGKCFTQLPTLHRHKFLHISDSEKNFFCDVCAKKFPAYYLLKSHMLVHRPPSICPHCDKSFLLPSGLKIHIKAVHSGQNPYTCKICFKVFTQSSTMFRHMNLHNRSTEYTCDDCGKVFNVFYYLKKHIANVHSKAFSCELCSKTFSKPHQLASHMARNHTNTPKPNLRISRKDIRECYICARGFNYNGLSRHIIRCKKSLQTNRSKAKQYKSSSDIKIENQTDGNMYFIPATVSSIGLQQEQQPPPQLPSPDEKTKTTTSTTNRYKCNICNIIVGQASTLTRHMKIHSREIHKCSLCDTEFNRYENLDKHRSDVHNADKPFQCNVCKRTFSHLQTLESHQTIHVATEFKIPTVLQSQSKTGLQLIN